MNLKTKIILSKKNKNYDKLINIIRNENKENRKVLIEEIIKSKKVSCLKLLMKIIQDIDNLTYDELIFIINIMVEKELIGYYFEHYNTFKNKYNSILIDYLINYSIANNKKNIINSILHLKIRISKENKAKLYNYIISIKDSNLIESAIKNNIYNDDKKIKLFNIFIEKRDKNKILDNYFYVKLLKEDIDKIVEIFINNPSKDELLNLLYLIRFSITYNSANKIFNCITKEKDIYKFLKALGKDRAYMVKEYIINKNNRYLLANYIYFCKDMLLAKEMFNSIESYILFCYLNKEKLNIDIKDLSKKVNDEYFNYVDNNIVSYIKNKK